MDRITNTLSSVLSGGSSLNGSLRARQLELAASGGSQTMITGRADSMSIDTSGGVRMRLDQFQVKNAKLINLIAHLKTADN